MKNQVQLTKKDAVNRIIKIEETIIQKMKKKFT